MQAPFWHEAGPTQIVRVSDSLPRCFCAPPASRVLQSDMEKKGIESRATLQTRTPVFVVQNRVLCTPPASLRRPDLLLGAIAMGAGAPKLCATTRLAMGPAMVLSSSPITLLAVAGLSCVAMLANVYLPSNDAQQRRGTSPCCRRCCWLSVLAAGLGWRVRARLTRWRLALQQARGGVRGSWGGKGCSWMMLYLFVKLHPTLLVPAEQAPHSSLTLTARTGH